MESVKALTKKFKPDIVLLESGGDNLAANFSRELADYIVYCTLLILPVFICHFLASAPCKKALVSNLWLFKGGDKIPRKGNAK